MRRLLRSGVLVSPMSPFWFPPNQQWLSNASEGKPIRSLLTAEEEMVLDMIDAVKPTGTLSRERIASLAAISCDRCVLAYRAAVEVFVESRSRGQVGIRVA